MFFLVSPFKVPSKDMFIYAAQASIGDAVYGDVSTKALEAHIARLTGKEAALLMVSN
jgi:threonine aldolase